MKAMVRFFCMVLVYLYGQGSEERSVRGRRIQESDGREIEGRRGLSRERGCVCVQAQ